MCSQHFEPNCYKVPGTKANLRYGAIPTLDGPSDEPDVEDVEPLAGTAPNVSYEVSSSDEQEEGNSSAVAGTEPSISARKRKKEKLDDPFYDFLADNDDADKDGKQQKFRKGHLPFCVCSTCRSNRAAKAMEKNMAPNKAIQTADNGPQPDASPVPMGLSQDSCRLCFSTDQLEPLCSGMIVVRDEMLDKIYVCTGVLIIPRPKVSIFICTPCAQLINSFHAYRQQVCSNNQALLRTMALKALKTSAPAPKIQKVAPLPPQKVRKVVSVPIKRKPPVGLIPVIDTPPMLSPQSPPVQYRKIAPKLPMVVEPEVTVVPPIKDEQDDPLEGCGDTTQKVALSMARTSNILVKLQSKPIVVMKKEQPGPALLHLDAEEGQDGLPEGERWQCWHCENSFPFQFECAKHLLQVHEENVGSIKRRLKLDELNANMLQMMSLNQKK
ncbi:uncharacterized protein LOC5575726 isoform X2 [Aedes aegypti]|nr:uncharacterized protein LOC5575726 isoform X2 [Aedes aegypti]XP_021713107.1 uncharacterized protein LOC5575726 isoform X2 [Aedes aegypti]